MKSPIYKYLYVAIFFVCLLISLLVSCSSDSSATTEDETDQTAEPQQDSKSSEAFPLRSGEKESLSNNGNGDNKLSILEQAEVTLIGYLKREYSQRMTNDNNLATLIQEQSIGWIPVVFEKQKAYFETHNSTSFDPMSGASSSEESPEVLSDSSKMDTYENATLVMVTGHFTTETVNTVVYDPSPNHSKPTSTHEEMVEYRYFLAKDTLVTCNAIKRRWDDSKKSLQLEIDGSCLNHDLPDIQVRLSEMGDADVVPPIKILLEKGEINTVVIPAGKKENVENWLDVSSIENLNSANLWESLGTYKNDTLFTLYLKRAFWGE